MNKFLLIPIVLVGFLVVQAIRKPNEFQFFKTIVGARVRS